MARWNLKPYSLVLLGIFFLMMAHNVVPHTHHNHGELHDFIESTPHHHHGNSNSHEHPDDQSNEEENDDEFLLLIFKFHSHSNPTSEFISKIRFENNTPDEKLINPHPYLCSNGITSIHAWGRTGKYYVGQFGLIDNLFISNCSSRAPPCLG